MNKLFAIGDLHLSFASEKPMDIFGEEWDSHAERVEENWRSLVSPEDYVIIAGDISWALKFEEAEADLRWIHELPGKKILVRGNHDFWWQKIKALNALYEDMTFLQNTHILLGELAICGSRGWGLPGLEDYGKDDEKILARELERMKLSLNSAVRAGAKEILVAMHFPPAIAPTFASPFTELFARYPVKRVVYGHLHGEKAFGKGIKGAHGGIAYQLVSLDFLDCKPFLLTEVH